MNIKLGEWKTDHDPDCDEGVDYQDCDYVVEIPPQDLIIHESYRKNEGNNKYKNDIAIIKLSSPPRKSDLISNINLPDSDECRRPVEDETWTVTGFGKGSF